MNPPMDPKVYVDDIRRRAFTETHLQDLGSIFRCQEFDSTRASVVELRTSGKSSHTGITSLTHLITKIQELDASWGAIQSPITQKSARAQLVVVENPSPDFINFLGSFYEVSPEFFVDHAAGCGSKQQRAPPRLPSLSRRSSFMHLNGIQSYTISDLIGNAPGFTKETDITSYLENRRHYFKRKWQYRSDELGFYLEDRSSYFVKSRGENDWVAVCLIDPRLSPRKSSEQQGTLQLESSEDGWQGNLFTSITSTINNRGFSLHDAFTTYLAQDFTIEEFIEDVFSPSAFLYLHLALTLNEQITQLDTELSHPSLVPESPCNFEITRSSLHYMVSSIKQTCEQLQCRNENPFLQGPNSRRESWSSSRTRNFPIRSRFQDLHQDFKNLHHQTDDLQSYLTLSINLYLATANFRDTSSIKQTESKELMAHDQPMQHPNMGAAITKLTILLSIYLPLIFASIVFGMNVQEMNSTGPQVAIFVVVAFGLVSFTFLACMICKHLEGYKFGRSLPMFWGARSGKGKVDAGMV